MLEDQFELNFKFISHENFSAFPEAYDEIENRLIARASALHDTTVKECLDLLHELASFPFGKFLIQNRSINAHWMKILSSNSTSTPQNHLEEWIFNKAPLVIAIQQRLLTCKKVLSKYLNKKNAAADIAFIPGLFVEEITTFVQKYNPKIHVIDKDQNTLQQLNTSLKRHMQIDSLDMYIANVKIGNIAKKLHNKFDIVVSHGLNLYEPDRDLVVHCFSNIRKTIKDGGKLISSFLNKPPSSQNKSSWSRKNINIEDLRLQRIIMSHILNMKWQAIFYNEKEICDLIKASGFASVDFYFDKQKIFPTIVANTE